MAGAEPAPESEKIILEPYRMRAAKDRHTVQPIPADTLLHLGILHKATALHSLGSPGPGTWMKVW